MKKMWFILLVINIIFATAVFAEEEIEEFGAGDYFYCLLEDGSIEITDYYGDAENLAIPDNIYNLKIASIGDYAFDWCENLTSVTIPKGVASIGDSAFYECRRLTSVTIPKSVTSIGKNAFSDCEKLSITVAKGSYAEEYCIENGLRYNYPDANNWLKS